MEDECNQEGCWIDRNRIKITESSYAIDDYALNSDPFVTESVKPTTSECNIMPSWRTCEMGSLTRSKEPRIDTRIRGSTHEYANNFRCLAI